MTVHAPYLTDPERQKLLPFRQRIVLGTSRLSATNSHKLLRALASLWLSEEYDMVEHNCHHWCCAAAAALGVTPPPAWVMRIGVILKFFSGMPSERERERERQNLRNGVKVRMQRRPSSSGDEDGDEEDQPLLVSECGHRRSPQPRTPQKGTPLSAPLARVGSRSSCRV